MKELDYRIYKTLTYRNHAQSLCRRDLKYDFKMAAILTKYDYLQDTNEF